VQTDEHPAVKRSEGQCDGGETAYFDCGCRVSVISIVVSSDAVPHPVTVYIHSLSWVESIYILAVLYPISIIIIATHSTDKPSIVRINGLHRVEWRRAPIVCGCTVSVISIVVLLDAIAHPVTICIDSSMAAFH
jgi:hypothetical protein